MYSSAICSSNNNTNYNKKRAFKVNAEKHEFRQGKGNDGWKPRQVDGTKFYLLLLLLWYVVVAVFFLTGPLWSHFKTFVFRPPNWFRAVNFRLRLEIRIHTFIVKRDRRRARPSSVFSRKGLKSSNNKKYDKIHSWDVETHKSNWIPIYDYITTIHAQCFRCTTRSHSHSVPIRIHPFHLALRSLHSTQRN